MASRHCACSCGVGRTDMKPSRLPGAPGAGGPGRVVRLPIALMMLALAWPAAGEPKLPLPSGQYVFQHRFAEDPQFPSIRVQVKISGSRIVVVNPRASATFAAGTLAEGRLMWHAASRQWIIGNDPTDKSAEEVGGCSDGPEVVDLVRKIYWTC